MISDYGGASLRPHRSLAARAFTRESLVRRLDWTLVLSALALCAVGALLVWSATRTQLLENGADPQHYLKRQAVNIVVGLACGVAAVVIDYRLLRAYAPLFYAATCFALILTLTPLGITINGSSSWLVLPGGFQIQPSELAKAALLVMLAMLLGEPRDGEDDPRGRDVLQALVIAVIPIGLILLEPDLGTSLVFGVMVLGMIGVSGAARRWLFGLIAAVALAAAAVIHFQVLEPYQLARFTAFADPSGAPQAATYSAEQARLAIGSGGLFGKGLFEGSLTNGQYVPEQQSDFIFTAAGEEFGFVGCAVIVALLGILLWRTLRIAVNAQDGFGMLVASGAACWFGFQAFENIGMTLGIMPITGIPLPFVSYGGSAMFASGIAVGLLVNVHLASSRRTINTKW